MMTRFQNFPIRVTPFFYFLAQCGILLHLLSSSITQAQVTTAITSDGTLGTTVTQNANINDISGGTRPVGGPNLFHSFGQFSVGAGDIASFNGPAGIANILSRVTGGDPSNIFGTIRSTIDGANLFLMNPAGVLFGPTASLDVSGSFHVTTADYLRLTDNVQFTAVPGLSDAGLSVASVAAFGFLNENPASINVNRSSLKVPEGETLSLIGGDITIGGNPDQPSDEAIPSLAAGGGRVNLVSVGSTGEVEQNIPDVSVDSFENLGEIELSKSASIDTSGDGGGTVVIRGGRLTVDESSRISASTIGPTEGSFNGEPGLGIDIQVAEEFVLDNSSRLETNVFTNVESLGSGGVRVKAQQVEIRNMAFIESSVLQASNGGKSGNIEVEANILRIQNGDQDTSDNAAGSIRSGTFSSADGGDIVLRAEENLEILNGGFVWTFTEGDGSAGDIDVKAGKVLLSGGDSSDLTGITSLNDPFRPFDKPTTGNTGNIRLTANHLEMDNGEISTGTFTTGIGGNVEVNVDGDVLISGFSGSPRRLRGILGNTRFGNGNGGSVQLTAHNLKLMNLASLQATTNNSGNAGNVTVTLTGNLEVEDRSFIQTRAVGDNTTGNAGDLSITAQDIVVTGISDATNFEGPVQGSPSEFTGISAAVADGAGGNLTIEANNLTVRDKAFVNTATRGSGNSGKLSIDLTGNLLVENGGLIFADAQIGASGNAGKIDIQADNIVLSGANRTLSRRVDGSVIEPTRSTITSQSRGEGGTGGNIQLTARSLSVLDGASITAESTSTGDAGSIEIRAGDSILIDNSAVTTEARRADGGNITLTAPNIIRLVDDSQLTTSVGGDSQTEGGNIDIDPRFVILDNDSKILAQAGEGTGGRIDISTDILFASLNNIDASSERGIDGTVDIDSPATDIISGTLELPESFLNVQSLLSTRCASRTTKPASSFFVTNGGLPLGPDTLIPAGVTGVDTDSAESDGPQSDLGDEIPELLVRTSAFGGCAGAM